MRPRRPVKLVPWFDDDDANSTNDNGCLWSTVGERLATIIEENEEITNGEEEEDEESLSIEEKDPWEDTDSEASDIVVDTKALVQSRIDEIRQKVKDGFDDDEEDNFNEAMYMETTDPDGSTLKLEVFLLKRGVAMFETVECDDDNSDTASTDSSSNPSTPTNKREAKVEIEKPLVEKPYKRIECIIKDGVKIPRPKDILFIFDYDDTVLPSTWCSDNAAHPSKVSIAYDTILDELSWISRIAQKTFDMCASLNGDICIITNAEKGWVESVVFAYLLKYLSFKSFDIISARSTYAKTFYDGGDGIRWKLRAFYDKVTKWLKTRAEWEKLSGEKLSEPSVYSFGDSYAEREALRQTCRDYNIIGKSFKFIEKPRPDHIRKQHRLLQGSLRRMMIEERDLDFFVRVIGL